MIFFLFFTPKTAFSQDSDDLWDCVVDASGGIEGDIVADCDNPCVMLSADYVEVGGTESYIVNPIPYDPVPPLPDDIEIYVSADDSWADEATDLPFDFCFYGETYNQLLVGPNAMVTFDLVNNTPGSGAGYSFSDPLPSSNLKLATIFGPMMDINIDVEGSSNVTFSVRGEYPCRRAVISYTGIPYYSCTDLAMTTQIVLYEGTNVIEVHLRERYDSCSFNNGNAVLGIQDETGQQGIAAPGRNTGNWSAFEESWRFVPNEGDTDIEFAWINSNGDVIGTEAQLEVCPTRTQDYIAQATYTFCDGSSVDLSDTVTVFYEGPVELDLGGRQDVCGDSYEIIPDIVGADPVDIESYSWSTGESTPSINVTETGTYSVELSYEGCVVSSEVFVNFLTSPELNSTWGEELLFCDENFQTTLVATPNNLSELNLISYRWYRNGVELNHTGSLMQITEAGEYTVVVTETDCEVTETVLVKVVPSFSIDLGDDIEKCSEEPEEIMVDVDGVDPNDVEFMWSTGATTQSIDVDVSGTYTVEVTYLGCIEQANIDVTFKEVPFVSLQEDFEKCVGEEVELNATVANYNADSLEYVWYHDGGLISGQINSSIKVVEEGTYTVEVNEIGTDFCYGIADVMVSYYSNADCVITQGLSPDTTPGQNDCFDLTFLAERSGIKNIKFYNRYGRLVFEQDNYVDTFCGQDKNGDNLPTGTYYYVFELKAEDPVFGTSKKGWVYINREAN